MDFAGGHYYRINRILLTCLGLWPYYTQCTKYVYCIFLFLFLLSSTVFQLSSLVTKEYSIDLLLNVLSIVGPSIYCALKYFATFINRNKVKELIEQIRYDWNSLKEEEELKIMHKRATNGRFYTIVMLLWLYSTLFLLILMLFSPSILNIVIPLNESRQSWQLPTAMEFFIDREKYANLLTLYLFLIAFISTSIMIATETLMIMYVQHICSMFQITGYRIERTLNKSHIKWLISSEKFNSKSIVKAVDNHRSAIKFVDFLKRTFSISHFFAIPLGVTSLSINMYLFCECIMAKNIGGASMSFLYIATHFLYIFFCNYIGQKVIDYSDDIFKKICSTRWYEAPLKIQKCLVMITYRSMKPSTLTVCLGLYLPSLQGFATNSEISLFETNIRFMGSLLACYALTGDVMFRDKAAQLGERMLPAFQTETGIPHSLINLHTGSSKNYGWASSGCSILSEIGTMHLEFTYLSDITNNPVFKSKVENVRKVLKSLEKPKGLYPNYIHPRTGKWGQHHMSLGGLGDSFYEYLLKAWIQSGKEDVEAREMYNDAIAAITEHMIKTSPGKLVYVSDLKYDRLEHKMGHLACFAGGMFALGAKTLENELSDKYMNIAAGLTNTCHESYDRSATKLGPEAFHFIEGSEARSLKNGEKYYILRPETFESYFVMWRLTKNPKYREWGWEAVQALEKHCRVPGGFTGLNNVYLVDSAKDDVQQSYFFAETLKYLYLLFSDDDLISLDDWVFNSEAHVLPIKGNPLYRPAPSL